MRVKSPDDFPSESRRSALILLCGLSCKKKGELERVADYVVVCKRISSNQVKLHCLYLASEAEVNSTISAGWVGWQKQKEINLSYDILQQLSKEGKISAFDIGEKEWMDAESPMVLERNEKTVKKIIKQMGF